MVKYKLIKTLPFENSPELGYISKPTHPKEPLHYWMGIWFNPKNYPEFWEEVVDNNPLKLEVGKTYKIQYKHYVSPILTVTITKITKDGYPWMKCGVFSGIFSSDTYEIIEEVVEKDYEILFYQSKDKTITPATNFAVEISKPGYWKIYSVKRLSDSEIFTVGDYIKMQWCSKKGIIESIYYNEHNQLSFKIKGSEAPLTSVFTKEYPVKCKKVLFTTEDGVGIFKGNSYYNVHNFTICNKLIAINPLSEHEKLVFSTKEAAEEYILMNKPCLTFKDLEKLLLTNYSLDELLKNMKILIKAKTLIEYKTNIY